MSRSPAALLAICLLIVPASARADDAAEARIAAMIEKARATYLPHGRPRCGAAPPQAAGEIVVCAPDNDSNRVSPTSETDPHSPQALDDGVPRAPDVSGLPDCSEGGCMRMGWAPPPVYMIDMKAIPEPPEGSDAEKIARGEMAAP